MSDTRKDPRTKRAVADATIVEVQSTSNDDYPVRFISFNDSDARDKARDDFIDWAANSLDGISKEWYRSLHGLAKCSKQWRRSYRKSKGTAWSDEDQLTLEIADILLLAEFVSFVHTQTLPASSELAQLIADAYRIEQKVAEWLAGARGLADAASQLRRCMRLELNQYAVAPPAQWPVLLDGTCVELHENNVPAPPAPSPAPAPARARARGGSDDVVSTKPSGSSSKCFNCHKSTHGFLTCPQKKDLPSRKVRMTFIYEVLGNSASSQAYKDSARQYAKSKKFDLNQG
jgi:hypothetical protein